jgi:hypothetical protein
MISLINVFTVDPASQHRLLDLLAHATDEFVSRGTRLCLLDPSSQPRRHEGDDVCAVAQCGGL